ncbi:hypothetical protein XM38_049100 [Halomicronema hongdechloris C2206]|uniref:Glycerol dehydrogenase n=1 Tax=Halomicronema hongdechloris C2206 TaxID=1641165 RepID=A0A1Z3HUI1_9CYAN|nr:DUF3119 family protein [Halomicronema hongdechloris]ASC73936.1 hypothetical protein XM38_049100 [Halomicronema hongdechloris C2206]
MTSTSTTETTILAPSYAIPTVLVLVAIPCLWVTPWLAGAIALFGMFLLVQALTLRLHFTDTALDIYRGEGRIRHFPYADWQFWQIFSPKFPVLFYFREVKSIHFLPILFDAEELQRQLEHHYPRQSSG